MRKGNRATAPFFSRNHILGAQRAFVKNTQIRCKIVHRIKGEIVYCNKMH